MKNTYSAPEIEYVKISLKDVILASDPLATEDYNTGGQTGGIDEDDLLFP